MENENRLYGFLFDKSSSRFFRQKYGCPFFCEVRCERVNNSVPFRPLVYVRKAYSALMVQRLVLSIDHKLHVADLNRFGLGDAQSDFAHLCRYKR